MGEGAEYFDREYFEFHDGKRRYLEHLVRWLRSCGVGAGRVLDVGSGFGFFLATLGAEGYSPTGLELSPLAAFSTQRHSSAPVVVQSAERTFPFADDVFDAVTSCDVIEHLEDFRTSLAESLRVLKPRGRLMVATINAVSLVRPLLGRQWSWYQDPTHVHLFSGFELKRLCREVGFVDARWRSFFNLCSVGETTPILKPLRIGRCLPFPFFGDSILVTAVKP